MKTTRIVLSALLLSCLFSKASVTQAATATGTLQVQATVISSCLVGTSSITWANYDPTSATVATSTGTIAVTCTADVDYTVALDQGAHGATVTTREMQDGGANPLLYFLNRSNCGTALCDNWGNTNGVDTVNGTGTGSQQNISVFGVIPINQPAAAGVYTDTVNITVTFPFP